jgi:hypothetical protein
MPPKVQIETVKHQHFLREFRAYLKSEHAEENLLFLQDKSSHELLYNRYLKPDAPEEINLPDKVRAPLTALAAQKRWSAMAAGIKEARRIIAANTNDGGLKRFMDSPAGRWPTFLLAVGVDGSKAQTMEALLKVYKTGRTPQDKQEAYAAMLKMTNKALLNPALRELGVEPPAPVIRATGDATKALKLLGVSGSQAKEMARLIVEYSKAQSKPHRATLIDKMGVVAKGIAQQDQIVAALKSANLYSE